MARRRPKGLVFVSYARADKERVEPLVKVLASRFSVTWDHDIQAGNSWRRILMHQLDIARCVVVVWTKTSVDRDFVWEEVERVQKRKGNIVPVKLDAGAQTPLGFGRMQEIDLTSWTGRANAALDELIACVGRLLDRPSRQRQYVPTLADGNSAIDVSVRATGELDRLSDKIRTLGGVLIPGAGPVKDLIGSLEEIHRTYASVSEAIARFVAPAGRKGTISVKPYLAVERGDLVDSIDENRGHCTRILEYYFRVDGIRDWLASRLEAGKLKTLDETFERLSTADGDLFESLTRIGAVMTEESSAIVGLLFAGQEKIARKRILDGRETLLPLQRSLSQAMSNLHTIASSLGYVPRGHRLSRKRRK